MNRCELPAGSAAYTAAIAATYDVAIIGGGIAGASLAYFLAQRGVTNVVLLERESAPGYHATGRSAATLCSVDFAPCIRRLKELGGQFLREPPADFADAALLDRSGVLLLFSGDDWLRARELTALMVDDGERLQLLSPSEASARIPAIARQRFDGAVWAADDGRIDVHTLLHGYLRHATRAGVHVRPDSEVTDLVIDAGRCTGVVTATGTVNATTVVNAAGAWVGELAASAGAMHIEFTPRRRTIITFDAPTTHDVTAWPLVCNETHEVYFAPESGGLLASPMDQTCSKPCDARPDELAIALAVDKLREHAPSLAPRSIRSKWAGLRTFSPDGNFVVGRDPMVDGFFWLAGQGGCGIETSPAVGRIAADLIVDGTTDYFDASLIAPDRFTGNR